MLDPRKEAAVEQAEDVDVEELVLDWNEAEVGDLDEGPHGALEDDGGEEVVLQVFLHLGGGLPRGEAHVGEEEEQVHGAEDHHVECHLRCDETERLRL